MEYVCSSPLLSLNALSHKVQDIIPNFLDMEIREIGS